MSDIIDVNLPDEFDLAEETEKKERIKFAFEIFKNLYESMLSDKSVSTRYDKSDLGLDNFIHDMYFLAKSAFLTVDLFIAAAEMNNESIVSAVTKAYEKKDE